MTIDALEVRAKRIYDPLEGSDGYRILIDAARDRDHNNAVVLAELLRDD